MNICDINKFVDAAGNVKIDKYRFDPINEEVTVFKGTNSVVIDLTLSDEDQLTLFQSFIDAQ